MLNGLMTFREKLDTIVDMFWCISQTDVLQMPSKGDFLRFPFIRILLTKIICVNYMYEVRQRIYIKIYELTLLMLETEYSSFGGQCHTCWCSGSESRQSISWHGIGYVGQRICIVVPEFISSTWVKPNPRYDSKCEYIFLIFKTIQHV